MQKVRIAKAQLVELIKKNRDEHREVFLKAQEGYREKAIAVLDEQLARARKAQGIDMAVIVGIVQPQDHTEDYDRVLEMLSLSVDDTIELTSEEFQNFVQDNWHWSRSWALSNSTYTDSPKLRKFSA